MKSLRSLEGYILIDNSNSPGVPDSVIVPRGLPAGSGKIKFESATATCSHCQMQVILNPDRSRPKGYCKHCEHYLCDECEAKRFLGQPCYPYKAKGADYLEAVDKGVAPEIAYETIFVKGERIPAVTVLGIIKGD